MTSQKTETTKINDYSKNITSCLSKLDKMDHQNGKILIIYGNLLKHSNDKLKTIDSINKQGDNLFIDGLIRNIKVFKILIYSI
jgi:hypothetical protein